MVWFRCERVWWLCARVQTGARVVDVNGRCRTTCPGRCARRASGVGGGRRFALTLRYANDEAKRQALPDDERWRQTVLSACLAQEPAKLELELRRRVVARVGHAARRRARSSSPTGTITAQKQHERSLKASERLNREILSGLQEGVVVVDTDARVVVANEAAAELFGVPLSELMDRPLSAIPLDLLDERGHLLAAERLPLMRALRGRGGLRRRSCASCAATARCCGSRCTPTRCTTTTACSTARSASYDDVTQRVEQDRRTRYEADTDPLTGPGQPARAGAHARRPRWRGPARARARSGC